jgi:predicted neuraminidase
MKIIVSSPIVSPMLGRIAALFVVAIGGTAWANDPPSRQPGIVLAEFIFNKAPFPSCHASTIADTSGQLLAAWFGGTAERHPDVGIWLSRREQDSWSSPEEVANGVVSPTKRYPTWNPVLFQPRSGPLMLFYKVGPSPSEWWGMMMTSSDRGRSWSSARRLPEGVWGPIKNKPIELSNGDILAPSSSEHAGWRVHFERSTDRGETWQSTGPLNDPDRIRAIQPSILVHQGGRLQAIGRTRASGIFQIWSDDAGKTWDKMTTTGLPNPSAGTDAVTLADGRHLLVYNHNSQYRGRSPLNVALSDDGVSWEAALTLEDESGSEFSYPAVIQTADGLVHLTYTWKRERIKHVILDPSKLRATPLVDGNWPTFEGKN